MLQKYWNSGRMPITMNKVLRQCKSPFYFFLDLGEFYQAQQFKFFGFQLDELFQYINLYLKEQYEDELIEDYLRLSKVKPKNGGRQELITKRNQTSINRKASIKSGRCL